MSSCNRLACACLALLTMSSLGACVDPKDRFGEFNERVLDAARVNRDGGGGLFEIDGEFLLAIAPSFAPTLPLRFVGTSDIVIEGGISGSLTLSFQPLAADICDEGNGGTPVGDPIEGDPVAVNEAGEFEITHDNAMVAAEANPISCGLIRADLVLSGIIESEDQFCGDVTGMVYQPTMTTLEGSTFGALRIEPGTVGDANLPEPLTACP